jgi:hypothetical protein
MASTTMDKKYILSRTTLSVHQLAVRVEIVRQKSKNRASTRIRTRDLIMCSIDTSDAPGFVVRRNSRLESQR